MVTGQTRMDRFCAPPEPRSGVFPITFFPQVLHGMSRAATAQGFHLLFEVIPPEDHRNVYMQLINERHVDGIVLSGTTLGWTGGAAASL